MFIFHFTLLSQPPRRYRSRRSSHQECNTGGYLQNPSNYRGISLLSNVAKLFEKLLLARMMTDGISINPLQGGFRAGYSSIHSTFIFQEAVQTLRDLDKKAYVAFLDVKKTFDTVWHEGLFVKLHQKGIHPRIWHSRSSSCFLLKGERSEFNREFARVQFCPPCSTLFLWTIFLPNWMTAVSALLLVLSTVLPLCMQMTSLILMTAAQRSTIARG